MIKIKIHKSMVLGFMVVYLTSLGLTSVWAHGEGTTIVPESLNVKAGSYLRVTVNGLTGTKTATFMLTGITGKFNLGKFTIESDDFSEILEIPSNVPPGNYRLTVEGGSKSARVVININ